ncbi:uncharacterized protein LOC133783356 [Humulus lupulus]|uniref:uncharacterized protein LOC133783356 n=1 Tax=Humulus lupulus TaxID=3486 RepID=UPI002B4041AD|nr:uncharacterized protein LOC133783356 [Humulus lupulus]XP_062078965.1 uncharacterized protein LOC133783356 [Humulus lupulus]XP_062078968.1 uncharacterized protein LOC133783356 [Humulus lupulus]
MAGVKRRLYTDSDIRGLHKELDEISCPICMDHPHNAVLLRCSSHDKGCRSYICDTSHRHSNCLDRFKKLKANTTNSPTEPSSLSLNSYSSFNTYGTNTPLRPNLNEGNDILNLNESNAVISVDLHEEQPQENNNTQGPNSILDTQEGIVEAVESESFRERVELDELDVENSSEPNLSLKCPLCRGDVLGWDVVEEARKYLNSKRRSCSRETCSFSGNYQELRRHARRIHPATRPSDIDPSRERAWRRLEHQRELGDVVSAIRSAMPGAVVVGDYVIENGDRLAGERATGTSEANGPWWTTLFLFQMIGSMDNGGESRPRPRAWTRHHRRSGGAVTDRRLIWGENLLGLQDDEEEDEEEEDLHVSSDAGDDTSPVPRRRRRLTRSRSDEDQP